MKINTKKESPVTKETPEAMINPNKYIPSNRLDTADNKSNKEKYSPAGRECKYLPTLVHTPVLTSQRKNKSNDRRLVSNDDIEELNKKLEELFLTGRTKHDDGKKDNTKKTCGQAKASTEDVACEKSEANKETTPSRFYENFFNYRTCKSYKVLRSARIAAK